MTTDTKRPRPGKASGAAAHPAATPGRVVSLRRARVFGALAALLVGVVSAVGATYLAAGPTDELDVRVDTLTAQVDSLAAQAGSLTGQVDTLAAQADGLAAEKEELTTAVADARARAESLGEENAALREQVAGLWPQEPVDARVEFGEAFTATSTSGVRDSFVLVVDVTVTNPDAAEDALFSKEDVHLTGPDDTRYPPQEQSPLARQRAQLPSLVLAPSERVRGRLVFYVSTPVSELTITYHGTTAALSL